MRKWFKAGSVIAVAAMLCFSSTYAEASQAEVDRLKQEANDASDAVTEKQNQKKQAESEKSELESEANSLTNKISDLNNQITSVSQEISNTEASISELEDDIAVLQEQLEMTQASLDLQKESMKKRIQFMYENQSTNQLVALLECRTLTELLTRLEYMAELTTYDQQAIADYEDMVALVEDTSEEINAKYDEMTAYEDQLSSQKSTLGGLVSSTTSALNDTNDQISNSEEQIAALEQQIEEAKAYEATILEQYEAAQVAYAESIAGTVGSYSGSYSSTDQDVLMLAAIIQAEAANQGDAGRLAVGSVVMNRVASSKFPNTIEGVITANNQFAPVASGRWAAILAQGPNSACIAAAESAIAGNINTDALFFCTYTYAQALHDSQVANGQVGFLDRTEGMVINAHYFYNYK